MSRVLGKMFFKILKIEMKNGIKDFCDVLFILFFLFFATISTDFMFSISNLIWPKGLGIPSSVFWISNE